jgi:hypothetical protein
MQVLYIESSALVAALLEHDTDVMKRLPASTRRVTSALTLSEAGRAIIRARTTGRLTAESEKAAVRALRTFERRCFVLDVNQAILERVRRPFPSNRFARWMPSIWRPQSCLANLLSS